ncbi:MAG: hypothetical protein NWS86_04440 [Flavobacteriales bacterium]|nr:hypothetical protein [Flavobacteriales bacterium]
MNKFYSLNSVLQWILAILLLSLGIYPAGLIFDLAKDQAIYYALFIFYVPLAQFAFTPFFKLIGVYRYYSPMLLAYMPSDKQLDLHSGTSFDYLLVMRGLKPGNALRNKILTYHLEGLLNIARKIENEELPKSVKVMGTSYFFSERTLQKFGFELEKASLGYTFNLYLNIIDLSWMYSLSRASFQLPRLNKVKKAVISGDDLLKNRDEIQRVYTLLKSKNVE